MTNLVNYLILKANTNKTKIKINLDYHYKSDICRVKNCLKVNSLKNIFVHFSITLLTEILTYI